MTVTTFEIASDSDNGSGYKTGGSYPPSSAYTAYDTSGDEWAIKQLVGATYETDVFYLRWDTSSIPDTDTISSAVLRYYATHKFDTDNRYVNGEWYDYGGNPSSNADYAEDVGVTAFQQLITAFVVNDWIEIPLFNPNTNINKTGYTGIRVGISGGAPTAENYIGHERYGTDPTLTPELVVTHAAVSAVLGGGMLMGVG